jgi:hypothetical protein
MKAASNINYHFPKEVTWSVSGEMPEVWGIMAFSRFEG